MLTVNISKIVIRLALLLSTNMKSHYGLRLANSDLNLTILQVNLTVEMVCH